MCEQVQFGSTNGNVSHKHTILSIMMSLRIRYIPENPVFRCLTIVWFIKNDNHKSTGLLMCMPTLANFQRATESHHLLSVTCMISVICYNINAGVRLLLLMLVDFIYSQEEFQL